MHTSRRARRPGSVVLASSTALLLGALVVLPQSSHAADRPIDGKKLEIIESATGARLTFLSRDGTILFPAIGGADDPSAGGAGLELFTQSGLTQALNAPAGVGNPGWKAKSGANESYLYRGAAPSIRKILLREGKLLKTVSHDAGLALTSPLGGVAIRLTTGTVRNCAVFPASTVSRDEPGRFLAKDSSGSVLTDCSDASLLAALSLDCEGMGDYPTCGGVCPEGSSCSAGPGSACTCVPDPEPCGDTAPSCNGACPEGSSCTAGPGDTCTCAPPPCGNTEPSCNGACPSGEECIAMNAGTSCACTPIGVTPCGAVDPAMCDNGVGACPPDETCQSFRVDVGFYVCACFDPNQPCGYGPGYCPPDSECGPVSTGMGQYTCYPEFCGGGATYPTCGGTCSSGRSCEPVTLEGTTASACVCAAPENECGGQMCGGYSCPVGEVCTFVPGSTACSCEPL